MKLTGEIIIIRIADMEEIVDTEKSNNFYTNAEKYWSAVPATVDGMLGGFGFISQTDIEGSEFFLKSIIKLQDAPRRNYALDCGAGIGRITKYLLTKYFKQVDLVEQNAEFLDTAKSYLSDRMKKIGHFFPTGLQNFSPEAGKYDVIWAQWVLGHLKDDDFVKFFSNCGMGLRENGLIIVKENVTRSGRVEIDKVDSSVTRPPELLEKLFADAGLTCIKQQIQRRMPQGLYPVYMFALRVKEQPPSL